jgi:hypothetical protein
MFIAAIQILNERAQDNPMSEYPELLSELVMAALGCKGNSIVVAGGIPTDPASTAFTPQQLQHIVNVGGATAQKLLASAPSFIKPVAADPAVLAYSAPRRPSASYVASPSPVHQPRQRIPTLERMIVSSTPYALPSPERHYRQVSQSPDGPYMHPLPRVTPERRYPHISPERHYMHMSPERHFGPVAPQNVHYPPLPAQNVAFDQLAREYGVEAGLVQALAERLEMLSGV